MAKTKTSTKKRKGKHEKFLGLIVDKITEPNVFFFVKLTLFFLGLGGMAVLLLKLPKFMGC